MIIKEFNKPLYHEKYYYRDCALTVENHCFGIFAWYESEYEEGYIHASPDWNSPFYSIFIVTEGTFENMDIYGNMVTMTPGSVMLACHPAGYIARSVNGPARRKCFHLYKTEFTKKLIRCFFPEGFVRLDLQDPAKGEKLFDRIKEEYCRKEAGRDSSALLGLVMELLEHIRSQIPVHVRNSHFDEILSCVESNLNNPLLNREFLCSECGTSSSTLDRLFRKHTLQSVNEYINNKRLEHARDLLAVTTLRIGEIAASSGFASTNHMNWLFRKKFGYTPSRYRKEILTSYHAHLNIQ